MRKGIAVWTMSKVVMFIFLVMIFSTVIMYTKVLNERVTADAAEAITLQIKSKLTALVSTDALEVRETISLPREIPEREKGVYTTSDIPLRPYTLVTMLVEEKGESYLTFAISLEDNPDVTQNTYLASSWIIVPKGTRGALKLEGDTPASHCGIGGEFFGGLECEELCERSSSGHIEKIRCIAENCGEDALDSNIKQCFKMSSGEYFVYVMEKETDGSGNVNLYLKACDIKLDDCVGGG